MSADGNENGNGAHTLPVAMLSDLGRIEEVERSQEELHSKDVAHADAYMALATRMEVFSARLDAQQATLAGNTQQVALNTRALSEQNRILLDINAQISKLANYLLEKETKSAGIAKTQLSTRARKAGK